MAKYMCNVTKPLYERRLRQLLVTLPAYRRILVLHITLYFTKATSLKHLRVK